MGGGNGGSAGDAACMSMRLAGFVNCCVVGPLQASWVEDTHYCLLSASLQDDLFIVHAGGSHAVATHSHHKSPFLPLFVYFILNHLQLLLLFFLLNKKNKYILDIFKVQQRLQLAMTCHTCFTGCKRMVRAPHSATTYQAEFPHWRFLSFYATVKLCQTCFFFFF